MPWWSREGARGYQAGHGYTSFPLDGSTDNGGAFERYTKNWDISRNKGMQNRMQVHLLSETDLSNNSEDEFKDSYETFAGFLWVKIHPGYEIFNGISDSNAYQIRTTDRVTRPTSPTNNQIDIDYLATVDPASGNAGTDICSKMAKFKLSGSSQWYYSPLTDTGCWDFNIGNGHGVLTLSKTFSSLLTTDPTDMRVIIPANPWIELKWYNVNGDEMEQLSQTIGRDNYSVNPNNKVKAVIFDFKTKKLISGKAKIK